MNSDRPPLQEIIDNGLCVGCGTCAGICPADAIKMIKKDGVYIPQINSKICKICNACFECCPGEEVDLKKLSLEMNGEILENYMVGKYYNIYLAHSTDDRIRYFSSSGGLVSQLLIFALDQNLVDGVIVTRMSQDQPLEPEVIIATTKEEILQSSGSKYCPVPVNEKLSEILKNDGRYAIVGLPCHIHAIRKLESKNRKIRERIVYNFGIFCANCVSFNGTLNFLKHNNIDPDSVETIRYRSNGWPGKIFVTLRDGSTAIIARGTTEQSFVKKTHFSSSFHYDFTPPRCLMCPDQTNILSDISFGDPWYKPLMETEKCGKSLIISRNARGEELLQACASNGWIQLDPVDHKFLSVAQNYSFKNNCGPRISILKKIGVATPKYNIPLKNPSLSGYLNILSYLPSFFSHDQRLWGAIKIYALSRAMIQKGKILAKFVKVNR